MPGFVEIGPLVRGKKVLNFIMNFHYYLTFQNGVALHLNFSQGCFVPSLVQIGPVVLEKEDINVKKFTDRQTDRQTDGRTERTEGQTPGDQKSSH